MRVWTKKSACMAFAWSALLTIMVAAGSSQSQQAQANVRIASSSTGITLADTISVAAVSVTAASPATRYAVQPGDTLSGIAVRLAVRGGWAALYAANRSLIGPDPDVIRPGAELVLPGGQALTRYVVAPGDTLAAIAAALAVRGGWPVLYAANRRVIGADPDVIRSGTVLGLPHPAARAPSGRNPGHRGSPQPKAAPAGSGDRPAAARSGTGMPSWLTTLLLAAGLLIGAAFLAEPVLAVRRRRAAARAARAAGPGAAPAGASPSDNKPVGDQVRIVMADYGRLVVTCSPGDGTVSVLRPPDTEPAEILRAARLVLPEEPYRQLAGRLGMPAEWPIVVADYDRLVVTCSPGDGTVYVLRPPGEDPKAILRAARLVLPECSYGELADHLGVSATWPMEHQPGVPASSAVE
jgi:LysM repeat protein